MFVRSLQHWPRNVPHRLHCSGCVHVFRRLLPLLSSTLPHRCEMLLPGSSMMDAVERQTESTLIAISGLVKEKYDAVLLW